MVVSSVVTVVSEVDGFSLTATQPDNGTRARPIKRRARAFMAKVWGGLSYSFFFVVVVVVVFFSTAAAGAATTLRTMTFEATIWSPTLV